MQFGKDSLYETDYEKNNIIKYRMVLHLLIILINGVYVIASGDNNSFDIRGDGFEIISDTFEKGKKAQLILKEDNLVCVELNVEKFEFKVCNLTVAGEKAKVLKNEHQKLKRYV